MKNLFFIYCFLFISSTLKSQEEMETDRPDQTECTSLIEPGYLQVETGLVYAKNNFKDDSVNYESNEIDYATTLIRIGILKNAELRIEAGEYKQQRIKNGATNLSVDGFSSIEIGTKIHITEENGIIPKTAFIGHLQLPIGSKNMISKNVTPSFRFTMSHTITKNISLGYNLGMEWEDLNSVPFYVHTTTVGFGLSDKFSCFIESFGHFSEHEYPDSNFDFGISFRPVANVMIDCSGGVGLNKFSNDYFLSAGFSFRIPK